MVLTRKHAQIITNNRGNINRVLRDAPTY